MLDLHRFMIAIARVSVNHDGRGGTAPDPLVWDQGSRPKALPGPPGFLNGSWFQVVSGHISGADVAAWPYCVGILIKFTSLLGTFHWPTGGDDLGHFGISFLELSRLRHLGWNQCSHGLTSRPLESCHHQCLEAVCGGFWDIRRVQLWIFLMAP